MPSNCPEEEDLVFLDRAAERAAKLMLMEVLPGNPVEIIFEVVGIQIAIFQILVKVAVKTIGAGFGDHIHGPAARSSEARVVGGRHDVDFLQRFEIGGELPCPL